MNKKFKLIFGSVVFLAGALLIVLSPSHFITTILMLIGIIFILNALIKRKVVFFNNIHNIDSAGYISIY